MQRAFQANAFYPARDLAQLCIPEPPDVFFSYHSAQNFVDVQEIAWKAINHAANMLREKRPDLAEYDVLATFADSVRIWFDFMFIDQAARDLRAELDALPELLRGATAHFVLGERPLTRAWCCYELALFNERLARSDVPQFPSRQGGNLRSYIAPSLRIYHGWEHTETSEQADKEFVAERIRAAFPGGFDGFNHIMSQANATAVLPITEGSTVTTPAADDNLLHAAEAWFSRAIGSAP